MILSMLIIFILSGVTEESETWTMHVLGNLVPTILQQNKTHTHDQVFLDKFTLDMFYLLVACVQCVYGTNWQVFPRQGALFKSWSCQLLSKENCSCVLYLRILYINIGIKNL